MQRRYGPVEWSPEVRTKVDRGEIRAPDITPEIEAAFMELGQTLEARAAIEAMDRK